MVYTGRVSTCFGDNLHWNCVPATLHWNKFRVPEAPCRRSSCSRFRSSCVRLTPILHSSVMSDEIMWPRSVMKIARKKWIYWNYLNWKILQRIHTYPGQINNARSTYKRSEIWLWQPNHQPAILPIDKKWTISVSCQSQYSSGTLHLGNDHGVRDHTVKCSADTQTPTVPDQVEKWF